MHAEKRLPQRIVLWDNDGPINNLLRMQTHYYDDPSKLRVPGSFLYEGSTSSLALNIYMDNRDLLKATLEILAENDVVSLLASQRITFGYAKKELIDFIDVALRGEEITRFEEKDLIGWKKLLEEELGRRNQPKLIELLSQLAEGTVQPKDLDAEQRELIINTKKFLQDSLVGEEKQRDEMYKGLDGAFGSDRHFLEKDKAEQIGQQIAHSGRTDATGKTKWMYVEVAQELFPGYEKLPTTLIDDNESYRDDEVRFQQGNFIHAPRTSNNPIEDNQYLGEVLARNVALQPLIESLNRYSDQAVAGRLQLLVFIAKGNELAESKDMNPYEKIEALRKMMQSFTKVETTGPTFLKELAAFCQEDKSTFLQSDPLLKNQFMLMLIAAIGKQLSEDKTQHTESKKQALSEVILTYMSSMNDNTDLFTLMKELHGNRYELLREKPAASRFGFLKSDDMAETWKAIIEKAQTKAISNVVNNSLHNPSYSLSEEEDKNIRALLSIDTRSSKIARKMSQEPPRLKEYKQLFEKGVLVVAAPRLSEKPGNK
jgi:hypothetical protein